MGANGAGKSTLVKILTGAVHPDGGTITVRGRPYTAQSPAEARRGGVVSVYQEPALIPDLDVRSNLRLTRTARRAGPPLARSSSGSPTSTSPTIVRDLPLATLRVIDLARALAIEPDVLMLDEMTAALPGEPDRAGARGDRRAQRGSDRSVIFISHRLIEIAAVCDRATVLREGETVGVVDVTEGSEDRIVALMLGDIAQGAARRGRRDPRRRRRSPAADADVPRIARAEPERRDEARRRLVRPLPGRGPRRRRPRGPGPGRAVRHPRRVRAAGRRRAARRRDAGRRSATPPTRSGPASSTSRRTGPRPC